MKYGVLYNKYNINIGDDIQAYATARFLPRVDYFIDREHIDEFKTEDGEPVAVIMNAWYMWAKWNWPPSKYILPNMIGFHYADHQLAHQPGSPIKFEFLEGILRVVYHHALHFRHFHTLSVLCVSNHPHP